MAESVRFAVCEDVVPKRWTAFRRSTMIRFFLRSEIRRATVTGADRDREDWVTIDRFLLNAAGLVPFEKVEVHNITNGHRFETHVLEGEPGGGEIAVHGAAAHLAAPGDLVSIACYCLLHEGQVLNHRPKLVLVDAGNQMKVLEETILQHALSGSGEVEESE